MSMALLFMASGLLLSVSMCLCPAFYTLHLAFGLALVNIVGFVYYCYLQPKGIYEDYIRQFESKGYRVHRLPFKPFRAPLFKKYL